MCGRHCRGKAKDNIGIMEFDTATGTVVGQHAFSGTAPVYAPFASPDGEHIILFGMNGGKTVDIIKAGSSGFKSTLDTVLTLDFNTTNTDDANVFDDFAYIQENGMNLFVVSSSSDYKVAIVDMDSADKDTTYVMLKDVPYTDRARGRQVEHVEGTDYVWIGGRRQEEAYVINVRTKVLVRTFTEVDARKLLSVTHHAFYEQVADFGKYMGQQGTESKADVVTAEDTPAPAEVDTTRSAGVQTLNEAKAADNTSNDDDSNDALSIAALVISCVAIAGFLANFIVMNNNAKQATSGGQARALKAGDDEDPSVSQPPSVQ